MGALFRLSNNTIDPAAGTRVVKAHEAGILLEADKLLAAAAQRVAEMEDAARAAYEQQRAQGYADGQEDCRAEYAEKMLEVALQSVDYLENLEKTIVNVVTEAVERVMGEMDADERIVRIVRTALTAVRNQQRVVVRVAPADEKAVTEALAPMLSSGPGGSSFLNISADPRLAPGSCILESELGVLDASLDTQLNAIKRAFNAKIKG